MQLAGFTFALIFSRCLKRSASYRLLYHTRVDILVKINFCGIVNKMFDPDPFETPGEKLQRLLVVGGFACLFMSLIAVEPFCYLWGIVAFLQFAYDDVAFQIGEGQTISQPYTVAYQTQLLQVKPFDKILEIGTGSIYQATVLAEMKAQVFTTTRSADSGSVATS